MADTCEYGDEHSSSKNAWSEKHQVISCIVNLSVSPTILQILFCVLTRASKSIIVTEHQLVPEI